MQKGNPLELNFGYLEMQKLNITTNEAQRVVDKNGVICVVIM